MKVPFHRPILPLDINAILNESINSGWVTTGPKVKSFEEQLQNYLGAKHVIAVNSGTAALHLALSAKGLRNGNKFIAPTYTFIATVEAGEYLGAQPVLVDADPVTFTLDLDQVEHLLINQKNNEIKAIIPMHFAGQAVDMDQIHVLAEKYNLFVLEDAAHALETISDGGKVGNTNHAAAFSFYANKNITTGGEGGALATNDSKLADKVRNLSLHGMSKDGWNRYETGGKWAYDVTDLGYKYNMTDIAASFGLEQLIHIEDWHRRRLEIVKKYHHGMKSIDGIILPKHVNGTVHAWHLYVIRIVPERWQITRNELIERINQRGIGTSVHYIPVHMYSYYIKKYGYKPEDFPVAKQLSETVITLPLYPRLNNNEIDYIVNTMNELWDKYKC